MVGTLPRRTPRRRELIHLFVQLVHQGTPVGLRGQACYARCATDCCQGSCPNEFAHGVPPPRNNAVVQLCCAAVTSRAGRAT